ncbi:tyrosine-type recombinase/integrase, partial [Polaromonas sp. P5_E6]
FGVYPVVSLRQARELSLEARRQLHSGVDPGAAKKLAKIQAVSEAVNTLEACARDWMKHQSARWAEVTTQRIASSFELNIFPSLGARPIASIRPGEIRGAVQVIEVRGAGDQASRVLQRVKSVFRWALTHGRLESNPMVDLVVAEILRPREAVHRAALPEKELPRFLKQLNQYDGDPHTVHALKLLMLTAVRPGEVRGARWAEVDFELALWTIPAERMKMGVEHKVPLSIQAVAVLDDMKSLSGSGELIFPSPVYPSKPLSENTFNSALARMGYKNIATAHGFRALFSTMANEAGWNADAIERQLAHKELNVVRAAYHRATYLPERVKLMKWWADRLDTAGLSAVR